MDWKQKARVWIEAEAGVEQAHDPVATELLDRAELSTGQSVLDIGCGSGGTTLSAARLVGQVGTVAGIDIAPHMIERAQTRAADLDHVTMIAGDAQTYAFEPQAYDLAISLFGMMFYADPGAAFANIRTAIRPKGRILFAAWAGGKDNPWFSLPGKAANLHVREMPTPPLHAPGPMAFADADRVIGLFAATGWENPAVEEIDLHLTPLGSPHEISAMLMNLGPVGDMIGEHASDDEDALRMTDAWTEEVATEMASFAGPAGIRVPAKVRIFSAQNPA